MNQNQKRMQEEETKPLYSITFPSFPWTYRSHNCIACPWLIEQGKAYEIHDPELLTEGTFLNEFTVFRDSETGTGTFL